MQKGIGVGLAVVAAMLAAGCGNQDGGDARGTARQDAPAPTAARVAPAAAPLAGSNARTALAPVADLPDQGVFAVYGDARQVRRAGPYTWHPVALSAAHVLSAGDAVVRVPMPDGSIVPLRRVREIWHGEDLRTWVGRSELPGGQEAIITFGKHSIFGTVPQPHGPPLRITTRDLQAWFVETDPARVRAMDSETTDPSKPDFRKPTAAGRKALGAQAVAAPSTAGVQAVPSTDNRTVDLLVGYTVGFKNQWVQPSICTTIGAAQCEAARRDATLSRLNYLVDLANQSYINSAIAMRVRMVNTVAVNYTDANLNDDALYGLSGTDGENNVPVNPAFAQLRNLRESYGADLVTLVRKFNEPENEGCGIAWLLGGDLQGIHPQDAPYAYSVVSDGQDDGTEPGYYYFCRDEALAHELGHNMGSTHDIAAAGGQGVFPYSYGYKAASFYTVMAYGDDGQIAYRVFSNPRITYCGGQACGTAETDNARSINNTSPTVSAFRAAKYGPLRVLMPSFDGNGDKKSDLFFRGPSTAIWFMNGTTRTQAAQYQAAFPDTSYDLIDSGDMNGDGRSDWLAMDKKDNTAKWAIYAFYREASGTAGFQGGWLDEIPSDYRAIALADVNGDKISEVVLRNPYTGAGAVWYYVNNARTKFAGFTLPAAWAFQGHGDLNGDKRSDLVFANAAGNIAVSFSNGSTFAAPVQLPLAYDPSYALAAVQDISGDGRADLVFWRAATRQLAVWFMNGTTRTATASSVLPTGWWLVGRGDFNGDNRGDLVWSNVSRNLLFSISNGTTFTHTQLAYPAFADGWKVMAAE